MAIAPTHPKGIVSVTAAVLSGLFLGEIFPYFPLTLSCLLTLFLLFDALFRKGRLVPLSLFFCAAVGFGAAQLTSIPLFASDLRRHTDRGPIHIIAQVDGPPGHAKGRLILPMRGIWRREGTHWRPAAGAFRLTVYNIHADADTPFEYGDQLEMEISLRRPRQFENPGVFPYADYNERQGSAGVAGLSRLSQVKKVGQEGSAPLKKLYLWRDTIRKRILSSLSGEPAALLMALIIGDSGGLTDAIREVFSASGTTHILSISGSHLALVSLLMFGAVRWLILRLPVPFLLRLSFFKLPSQWAALATACAVSGYAFLAGGEMATLRSLTMILVYLFAIWLVQSSNIKVSLAVAALLILAFHPRALFNISFQLSFVSVLSILLTLEWWNAAFPAKEVQTTLEMSGARKRWVALKRIGRLSTLSTLGATLGTAPLTLYYFHTFSWVGLLANPLIIPVAGGLIVPLGLLSTLATPFVAEGFPLARWHQALGEGYFATTAFFARLPGADFHAASPPVVMVILFYGILPFLMVKRASWKWLLPTLLLFFSFFLGFGSLRFPPKTLRVTFLDVGQGDATLLEFSDGRVMLVDAGSGGDFDVGRGAVAPYLWQRRIRTIDYLVGTHPQMDHMGGLGYIARKFSVGEVWTNGVESDAEFYRVFQETLLQRGWNQKVIHRGTPPLQMDGCQIVFLNPPEAAPLPGKQLRVEPARRAKQKVNNHSIVFRLSCPAPSGDFSILMTGDIEKEAEAKLITNNDLLRSTILKVPHHGSRSSLDAAFLSAVSPRVAMISAGRRNRYRHPHPEALAAYQTAGARIYRTDQDGALFVEAGNGPDAPHIQSHRAEKISKISRSQYPTFSEEVKNLRRAFR